MDGTTTYAETIRPEVRIEEAWPKAARRTGCRIGVSPAEPNGYFVSSAVILMLNPLRKWASFSDTSIGRPVKFCNMPAISR